MGKCAINKNSNQGKSAGQQRTLHLASFVRRNLYAFVIQEGMRAVDQMLLDDQERLCGPRHAKGNTDGPVRWGRAEGRLAMGGRRVVVSRPRVRQEAREVVLPTWAEFADEEPLNERTLEQLVLGVSTRGYERSVEELPEELEPHGASKSAASRRFVATTQKRLDDLRYVYAASGQRVLKTAIDASNNEAHTVYIFSTLELRRTWWTSTAPGSPNDYALTPQTQYVSLPAGAARARIIYSEEDLPTQSSGHQHVFLELSDHLGSGTFIIDRATSELVEHSTYMAYGAVDSDYRPGRWGSFREPYKFGGKEEDVQVGLQYFGARYLVVGLGRWASADPATVHALRSDPNPYSYVGGRPMVAIDPDGREVLTAIAVGIVVGAIVSGGVSAGTQYAATGSVNWGWKGVGGAALGGALAGGVTGGLGAAGAGLFAGVAGGATGSGTAAAINGSSAGGVAIAAGLGGLGGLAGSLVSGALNDATLHALEGTGMRLSTALHVSAAISGTMTGAAMGLAVAGIRDFGGADVDYGQAAAIGAGSGAAGYLGTAISGGVPDPGQMFSSNEAALRHGATQNQIRTNTRDQAWEWGSFAYEWGGTYYATAPGTSRTDEFVDPGDVHDQAWIPAGARLSGFAHSHPLGGGGKGEHVLRYGKPYNYPDGMHTGDVSRAARDDQFVKPGAEWAEAVSSPSGTLEFWRPGMSRPSIQPPISVPAYRRR